MTFRFPSRAGSFPPFTKEICQLPFCTRCSAEADSKRTSSLGGPRRLDSLEAWSTDWSVRCCEGLVPCHM
jgi:hypothetical protein